MDEEIPPFLGEHNRYPLSRIACPNIEAGIPRPTMDSQKIQVRVESGKYGIFDAILPKVRSRWSQKMRTSVILRSIIEPIMRIVCSRPYFPASVKTVGWRPKPTAAIWARSSTARFIDVPHLSNVGSQLVFSGSACGITFGALMPGNAVS